MGTDRIMKKEISVMLKLFFENAEDLMQGIGEVADILKIEAVSTGYDYRVSAKKVEKQELLHVCLKGDHAVIEYGEKAAFFRGLMQLCKNAGADFEISEHRRFKTNGAMFDMSRNSVFKPETVAMMMRYMALMGLNMFMLYTEDTYEVEGYPYFGHMRGRYTAAQIKEMEDFGEKLGIELVPCIQLLAHLATSLRWDAFGKMRDTHDILLADSEQTYEFIDSVLHSVSKMYKSRRVHMGMDEARFLGQGRYLKYNPYCKKSEIFCRHLSRCRELALKHGLKPMMWSDMFFEMAGEFGYNADAEFSEGVKAAVPKDVDQVYWSYSSSDESAYAAMLEKHREITDNVIFAGGIWTWVGPCPEYARTISATRAALSACIKQGVSEVFATVWHNGAECPLVLSVPGLMIYAEMDYTGALDMNAVKESFRFMTGFDAEDILDMDIADHPAGDDRVKVKNPTRYLLYNDPLAGLLDKHAEGLRLTEFYGNIAREYKNKGPKDGFFLEAFEYYRAVIDVLEYKGEFGLVLKAAYDKKDIEKLRELYALSFEIEKRLARLHQVHRSSWLYYNKANGFEVFDMIYGALKARFETLRIQLDRLFADTSYVIDELVEERLPFSPIPQAESPAILIGPRFTRLYSANVVATVFNDTFIG